MRLLIDCSNVNFLLTTGIPKVTLNYLEAAYDWGRKNNVEVLPVIPRPEGMFIVRPVPGANAPEVLRDLDQPLLREKFALRLQRLAQLGAQYTRDILYHGLLLIASIVRVPGARRRAEGLAHRFFGLTGRIERFFDLQSLYRRRVEPKAGDILFSPAYWHDIDPKIYQRLKSRGLFISILVHDLLPITHAGYYHAPWCDAFRENVKAAFSYTDAFFCDSGFTRDALLDFARENRLEAPPVQVAHLGFAPFEQPRETTKRDAEPESNVADLKKAFGNCQAPLLMVGTVEPKKGHVSILETLEAKWQRGYGRPLVIVGNPGWLWEAIGQRLTRSRFFASKLFWLKGVDDIGLDYAYRHCHGLIFASIAEGFGLPMVEAPSYGKPALVLKTDIAMEILGKYGMYFEDAPSLSALLDQLEDPETYAKAVQSLAGFRWPTWKESAPPVFERLAEIAQDSGVRATPNA